MQKSKFTDRLDLGLAFVAKERRAALPMNMKSKFGQSDETPLSRAAASGALPRLEANPGVCGGEARVVNTRISVWLLESSRRQGATEKRLLADYPGLEVDDLRAAWDYAQRNSAEIEAEIAEHEAE